MRKNPLEWLSEAMLTVTLIPVLGMMGHVTLDVAMKFLFNHPIEGTLEMVATYYMVATVVLPIAFIEWSRTPIMVDLFYNMMSRPLQLTVVALALLVSAVCYAVLALNTFPQAVESWRINELVAGRVTIIVWPSRAMLPAAFALAALVCTVQFLRFVLFTEARDQLATVEANPHPSEAE